MSLDYPPESLSPDTPGLPEVIVNGRKVAAGGKEAVAEIYELINTANLARLRRIAEDKSSQGIILSYDRVATPSDPSEEIILARLGQSVSIVNDGPGILFVEINSRNRNPVTLNPNEAQAINFENHVLDRLYVRSAVGNNASARIMVKS